MGQAGTHLDEVGLLGRHEGERGPTRTPESETEIQRKFEVKRANQINVENFTQYKVN